MKKVSLIYFLMLFTVLSLTQVSAKYENNQSKEKKQEIEYHLVSEELLDSLDVPLEGGGIAKTPFYIPDEGSSLDYSLQGVIIPDDRELVTDTSISPYKSIVYIEFTNPAGLRRNGTGFLIDANTVVTAAHVVYGMDGWNTSFDIDAGRDGLGGSSYVCGTAAVHAISLPTPWRDAADAATDANDYDYDYDWAVLTLNWGLGNTCGYFGLTTGVAVDDDASLTGYKAHDIWGTPLGLMYNDDDKILNVWSHQVEYAMDCSRGQSGSPIWSSDGVMAIHSHADTLIVRNYGARMTTSLFNYLNTYHIT
ncbi:trypsin-like peptidase domain-containing protein [Mycoplasmatota bacterium zrk1]